MQHWASNQLEPAICAACLTGVQQIGLCYADCHRPLHTRFGS